MSAQLVVLGSRRPDSDQAYEAYLSAAAPLLFGGGGTPVGQYRQLDQLVGDAGPQVMLVMDFPDQDTIRSIFESDEYRASIPHRDEAFERLDVLITTAID